MRRVGIAYLSSFVCDGQGKTEARSIVDHNQKAMYFSFISFFITYAEFLSSASIEHLQKSSIRNIMKTDNFLRVFIENTMETIF